MATLRKTAEEYEPKISKTVADLDKVNLDNEIADLENTDKNGNLYKYKAMMVNGEEYRVPITVIDSIKTIVENNKNIKSVKVIKKGKGLDTSYTVIPLND